MKYGEVRRGSIGYIGIEKLTPQLAEEVGAHEHATARWSSRMTPRLGGLRRRAPARRRHRRLQRAADRRPVAVPRASSPTRRSASTATVKVLRDGRTMEFKLPIVSSAHAAQHDDKPSARGDFASQAKTARPRALVFASDRRHRLLRQLRERLSRGLADATLRTP